MPLARRRRALDETSFLDQLAQDLMFAGIAEANLRHRIRASTRLTPHAPVDRSTPPVVTDPDLGIDRPCATDDECENPEDHREPCPPGYTRGGPGGACARPFTPSDPFPDPIQPPPPAPPTQSRGPLVLPPEVLPPQPVLPGPSPADQLPPPRFPRTVAPAAAVLRGVARSTIAGILGWMYGTLIIGPGIISQREYDAELGRVSTKGPPRRRTNPQVTGDVVPDPRVPRRVPGPFSVKLPSRRKDPSTGPTSRPVLLPNDPCLLYGEGCGDINSRLRRTIGTEEPVLAPPRPLPRTSPTVRGVPAPAGWTLGDPIEGPSYDPFITAPPTPSPIHAPTAPRTVPSGRPRVLPLLPGWIADPRSVPRVSPRTVPRSPLRPQQPSSPRTSPPRTPLPRKAPAPFNPLTPLQDPVPRLDPTRLQPPNEANPCTVERTARRRRQKECKRFTTKTIRVCADK